jgi:hypothetical protein
MIIDKFSDTQQQNNIQRELIEMGFDIKTVNKILSHFAIQTLEQAIDYLVKNDGLWNHPFVSINMKNTIINIEGETKQSIICDICSDLAISHKLNPLQKENINEIFQERIKKYDSSQKIPSKGSFLSNKSDSIKSIRSDRIRSIHNKPISDKKSTCQICLEELLEFQVCKINCGEIFCKSCISDYLSFKILSADVEDIPCPNNKCKSLYKFTSKEIIQFINEDMYKKYEIFIRRNQILRNPDYIVCPFPDCDSYASKKTNSLNNEIRIELENLDPISDKEKNKNLKTNLIKQEEPIVKEKLFYKCLNGHEFCIKCKHPAHKNSNCEENYDKVFNGYVKSNNVKKCPQCNYFVVKLDGCNHMTCANKSCNYQFCWLCMGEYTPNHYSSPFSACLGAAYGQDHVLRRNRIYRFFRIILIALGWLILLVLLITIPTLICIFMTLHGAYMEGAAIMRLYKIKNPLIKKFLFWLGVSFMILMEIAFTPLYYIAVFLVLVLSPFILITLLFI